MTEQLKPCPFCGGNADIVRSDDISGHPRWYKVYCKKCQNRTWEHPRKKNAVLAWNTRAPAKPDAELVERLLDLLKSVGHHGIDVGYGEHQIGIYEVKEAQLLYEEVAALTAQPDNNT